MNHRDRALAAMRGRPVDHIPFIARMDLWYSFHRNQGTLPPPYEKASLWDIQRDLGIGIFGFGTWDISFYRLVHPSVEISQEITGDTTITRYHTPYGTLTWRDKMAAQLKEAVGTGARVEYPFKDANDYDEQMTPPPAFEAYFAPLYREARQILSSGDKILVVHGDGEMKQLLKLLMECDIEVVEALTPKPMTSIDIAETRRLWQGRVCMWGCLATVVLTDVFSDEDFERFMDDLFRAVAPGDRFILGFGDNVPTDALFHPIKLAAPIWADRGGHRLNCLHTHPKIGQIRFPS